MAKRIYKTKRERELENRIWHLEMELKALYGDPSEFGFHVEIARDGAPAPEIKHAVKIATKLGHVVIVRESNGLQFLARREQKK